MASKRQSADTYLHRPAGSTGTWYARVIVPRTLRRQVGQTHIRRSLQTASKAEANLKKHAIVGEIKAGFLKLRETKADGSSPGMSFQDARGWRDDIAALNAKGDFDQAEALELAAVEQAERVEQLYGTHAAMRWHRAATVTTENLAELMARWLDGREFRESTKMGHRKALSEVLDFIGDATAHPADLSHERALAYIDTCLLARGLAANTIRDRLGSLGSFWTWMGSRGLVKRGTNPWKGHHINRKRNLGTRPAKRKGGFSEDELLRLLKGNETVRKWPTYAYLPDLMVLGMFSGARIESLAAMQAERVTKVKGGYVMQMENDKTDAGTRPVGFAHPAAVAVVARRLKGRAGPERLFPEFRPGGADEKLSASASKAFGRYRRTCGVADGADFHSFRRNVATILEGAGLLQAESARFLGHKVGTLAADTYGGPRAASWALEVSRKVQYSAAVEAAAVALA